MMRRSTSLSVSGPAPVRYRLQGGQVVESAYLGGRKYD